MFAQAITKRKVNRVAQTPSATPAAAAAGDSVTIRRSRPGDGRALLRLALLDDRRVAGGPHVVAERAGEIVAAVPLWGGEAIADPFTRSADVLALLELRASQLGG
jgi:hypothetical protein